MRIAILGHTGMLGRQLMKDLSAKNHSVIGFSSKNIITQDSFAYIDLVINCTKPRLSTDDCELPVNREIVYGINVGIPMILTEWQRTHNYRLIHVSSDWVFDGDRDVVYNENSLIYPVNYYGMTKFLGELAVESKATIIRTTGVLGLPSTNDKSFLNQIVNAGKHPITANVDQFSQPISVLELSKKIVELVNQLPYRDKVLHIVGPNYLSRYELALKIKKVFSLAREIEPGFHSRNIRIPKYLRHADHCGSDVKDIDTMLKELRDNG